MPLRRGKGNLGWEGGRHAEWDPSMMRGEVPSEGSSWKSLHEEGNHQEVHPRPGQCLPQRGMNHSQNRKNLEWREPGRRRPSGQPPESPQSHQQALSLKLEITCKPKPRPGPEFSPESALPNLLKQKVISVRSVPCVLMLLASVRSLRVFWAIVLGFY